MEVNRFTYRKTEDLIFYKFKTYFIIIKINIRYYILLNNGSIESKAIL